MNSIIRLASCCITDDEIVVVVDALQSLRDHKRYDHRWLVTSCNTGIFVHIVPLSSSVFARVSCMWLPCDSHVRVQSDVVSGTLVLGQYFEPNYKDLTSLSAIWKVTVQHDGAQRFEREYAREA